MKKSNPLVRRLPYIDEYLQGVAWTKLLAKIGEKRPIVFIILNSNAGVSQVIVREESDTSFAERVAKYNGNDLATERVATALAPKTRKPPTPPPAPVAVEEPAVVNAEEKILADSIAAVAVEQGNQGEATIGRWVEFELEGKMMQGKIVDISQDESSFTIWMRNGTSVAVEGKALKSLIPGII